MDEFGAMWEALLPQEILRGRGASSRVGARLRHDPAAAPTVVIADTLVHDLDVTASLLSGLRDAGRSVELVTCAPGEPRAAAVQETLERARAAGPGAVIGIGGGSALDTAKLVARGVAAGVDVGELAGPVGRVDGFPELVLIPTTVGTGSEVTAVAMYTRDGRKVAVTSPQFVADVVVLDPELVEGLPPAVIASTALDALAHGVESWQSARANEFTRTFAARSIEMIFTALRPAHRGDKAALAQLQEASCLAGMALNAGVVLGHSLSYALAGRHPMPHGVGCALALPYCLAYNRTADQPELERLTRAALGRTASPFELAAAVRDLATDVGLPADLREFASGPVDAAAVAREVVQVYPRPNNPVPLEVERVAALVGYLQVGDLEGSWAAMGSAA